MSRFSAVTLDLSRLPPPLAIRGYDYTRIKAERIARVTEELVARGIPFDVGKLEANPIAALQGSDAYREMLLRAEINDRVRANMVAFAIGSDLDHLAAFYGLVRPIITPAVDGSPAVAMSDEEFRRRVLLAPESFATAGPRAAYIAHALDADPRVINVDVWSPSPGAVIVAVQSRVGDGLAPPVLVEAVRAHLSRDDVKPLTDMVTVRSVVNFPYAVSGTGYVLRGPDPDAVRDQAIARLQAEAAERRTPARDAPRSALITALQVPAMDKVTLATPAADIARGYGEVAVLTGIDFEVVSYDG